MSTITKKRHASPVTSEGNPRKRAKLAPAQDHTRRRAKTQPSLTQPSKPQIIATNATGGLQEKQTKSQYIPKPITKPVKVNKLVAPRPFPAVAASASATGPRSAHKDGKNYICLTRKTSLGAYMRRCKNLVMNDGYKTLHLHAMGAAIPLLLQLSCALPPILPFPRDEIHTDTTTGTVEVQDEIIPDDEEEDLSYRTRGKSTLYVILRIGDGQTEKDDQIAPLASDSKVRPSKPRPKSKENAGNEKILVFKEPEQLQECV